MARYAVLLHAQGLRLLNQDARPAPAGAYTWRVVEAQTPDEAKEKARIALLSDEIFLREIWNFSHEPPKITTDDISELESETASDSACVYYFDDESDTPYGADSESDDSASGTDVLK